jgi:calpain-15
MYKDKRFPANDSSLGEFKARAETRIGWKRGHELAPEGTKMRLFDKGITPSDIAQGALGDCWLLSALACLSEFPGAIEAVFDNLQYNPRGKYTLRLYDPNQMRFVPITIDDYFPIDETTGTPCFTVPNGNELWVMLLEKAFAKFCGSYGELEGGHTIWALQCLTGAKVIQLSREDKGWQQCGLRAKTGKPHAFTFVTVPSQPYVDNDELWSKILKFNRRGAVLAAGSPGEDKSIEDGRGGEGSGGGSGIIAGHAYSIIDVKACRQAMGSQVIRLMKLRNPWGAFEWKGDWSDNSPKWNDNLWIKAQLGQFNEDDDDGCFWMSFEDFIVHFSSVDVCFRRTGLDDMVLDVKEEMGCVGPAIGCAWGCAKYWCLCQGFYKLICSSHLNNLEKDAKAGPGDGEAETDNPLSAAMSR